MCPDLLLSENAPRRSSIIAADVDESKAFVWRGFDRRACKTRWMAGFIRVETVMEASRFLHESIVEGG
jgi:hypothetical protein